MNPTIPANVASDSVLAQAWKAASDLVALRNDDNKGQDLLQYENWCMERDLAIGEGRTPRPKLPYHKELVIVADAYNQPQIIFGTNDVFTEPPPVVSVPPGEQLTHTDSRGIVWYRSLIGKAVPWGFAYNWATTPNPPPPA